MNAGPSISFPYRLARRRKREKDMNKATSDKAKAFLAKQPTHIGTVSGYDFYEHPTKGDESPLMVITPDGKVHATYEWELPESPWSPALNFTTV